MLKSDLPVGVLLLGSLWASGAGIAVAQGPKAVAQPVQPSASATVSHSLDARSLGMAEALLDYCAKNDPTGAANVRARLKQLVDGASKQALAEARRSPEYRSAHDSEAGFVGKVEPRNAHRLCAQSSARSK